MSFNKFNEQGFIEEFHVEVGNKLKNLQEKIYYLTKDLIVEHNSNLDITEKLRKLLQNSNTTLKLLQL